MGALLLLVIFFSPRAECLDEGWYYHYRGNIGKEKGGLVLSAKEDALFGEFYFDSDYKDIPLSGKENENGNFELKSKEGSVLKGTINERDDSVTGSIIKNKDKKEFHFSLNSASAGDINTKYRTAGVSNGKLLEKFAAGFKEAVLSGNKKMVSGMLKYPIRVGLRDGKKVTIDSSNEFIKLYDKIFYEKYLECFRKAITHNMFAKASGIMLSSDDNLFWIWIEPTDTAGEKFAVTSIFGDPDGIEAITGHT